jgi:hypothetical protein
VKERGHGGLKQWRTWIVDAKDIDFPHLKRLACIRRDTYTLDETWTAQEMALVATSNPDMIAAEFHAHVRNHGGVENWLHSVRRERALHRVLGKARV